MYASSARPKCPTFSGAYTASDWLRSSTDSSSVASGRSRIFFSSAVKSRGSTRPHGGMRSLNSFRNSSRSAYFCSGGRSWMRNGDGTWLASRYFAASTFAAIMHSSISLCASLRWSMPACTTSPLAPSTKRTSLDSNSIAPRCSRAFDRIW